MPVGSDGYWDPAGKRATCLVCAAARPADPFAVVDPELAGTAGASAQVEFERRRARRRPDATNWEKGAVGERHLGDRLHQEAGRGRLAVLDDVRVPGGRANIDHIAVAPSGIFVIDAKNYTGRVARKVEGFGRARRERLVVGGRDRTKLVDGAERQVEVVRTALTAVGVPDTTLLLPVLCFVGEDNWGMLDPPLVVRGVHVVWSRRLIKMIRAEGPLDGATRTRLARLLSTQLRPAA